jgi:hypothetical protein
MPTPAADPEPRVVHHPGWVPYFHGVHRLGSGGTSAGTV